MGKLLRSLRAENMRLYSGPSAVLTITAVFVLSLILALTLAENSGADSMLPSEITEKINAPLVSVPQEREVEASIDNTIQNVITDTEISGSDISGSDIVSETDTSEIVLQTMPYEDWHDAYRTRYEELTVLNDEYNELIEESTGKQKEYYIAKQQECVREAFIINECLSNDSAAGYSCAWNVIFLTIWLMLLPIGILAAAVMASKTAGELKSGVINTLYTMPATRLKQYCAKYLSAAIFALLLCAAAWTGAVFGAMIGCGGISYEGQYIKVLGESVSSVSFFAYSAELTLCVFASVLILIALSAAVSTTARSQGAAIALAAVLGIAAMLFGKAAGTSGNIITGLSAAAVLDISAPLRGIPNFAAAGYVVSWLCAAFYWLVFIVIGYIGLRRDVK